MISSRTPEGSPNDCPVCGKRVRMEPSYPKDDAPCPHCGHLLWFEKQEPATELTPREQVLQALAEHLGVSIEKLRSDPRVLNRLGVDTIDLVMELEHEWR